MANIAVHEINFRGLAGAMFITIAVGCGIYLLGFSTTGWSIRGSVNEGLWMTCSSNPATSPDWMKATQGMMTVGLLGLLLSFLLAILYMCVHRVSKNLTLVALTVTCFISVIFMLIGFIIYGANRGSSVNWSFGFSVIGTILCLAGGIIGVFQMRESGVQFTS